MSLRDDISYVRKIQLHMNRVGLWENYRAITAVLEAALRAEQAALQPGQVAVDEADLRALVQMNDDWMQGHASCCKSCPLLGYSCTAEAQTDCRVALLQYFGLEPQ